MIKAFLKRQKARNARNASKISELQIETLEPRMMLNGDTGEVLFRAGFENANVAAGQFAFFQEVSGFTATGPPERRSN